MSSSLFVVTVALSSDGSRADLATMASVLHRRHVDVVEAGLGRPDGGRRVFTATFSATAQQAATVRATFEGLVDVLDADLYQALDARIPDVVGAR